MNKFEKKQVDMQAVINDMIDLFQKPMDLDFASKFTKLEKKLAAVKKDITDIREKEGKTYRVQAEVSGNLTFNVKAVSEEDARSQIKTVINKLQFHDLEFSVDHDLCGYEIDPVNEGSWKIKQ
jgi:hypothetical protein